jgi:predicted transcriptional regulator
LLPFHSHGQIETMLKIVRTFGAELVQLMMVQYRRLSSLNTANRIMLRKSAFNPNESPAANDVFETWQAVRKHAESNLSAEDVHHEIFNIASKVFFVT